MIQNKNSRIAYIIIFTAIIVMASLLYQYKINANLKDGEKFGDWQAICQNVKDEKGKSVKNCFIVQQAMQTKEDKTQVKISEVQFGYGNYEGKKELLMSIIVPLGVHLPTGVTVIAEGKDLILPAKFLTCSQQGCIAVTNVTKEEKAKLLKSKKLEVAVIINNNKKQIQLPLSNKGLTKALSALAATK